MAYFTDKELGILANYSGQPTKNVTAKDLQNFYRKLHGIVQSAINGLPCKIEEIDLRTLYQAAGKGKGYKFKDYLWIKVFYTHFLEDLVFFNITYDKDGKLILSLDIKVTDDYINSLYKCCSKAKEIKESQDNVVELPLSGKSEEEINNFIKEYVNNRFSTIINFYMALKNQTYVNSLQVFYNMILTGAPGTGKTFLAREIAASMIGCTQKELNEHAQFGFVQFHPSYDYTDFVEGLRPKQVGDNVVFERKDGIFKAFCKKAAEDKEPDHKYVFVIDEINRGEISKIFGELFFSIDPGYREEKDRIPVRTQYQNMIDEDDSLSVDNYPFKNGFYVPSNVYVIGTMNDIDRSVESMDFAFRRRFTFYEVEAKSTQGSILSSSKFKDEAIKKMDNLNNAIMSHDGFSASYHIGAAYFKKIDLFNGDWEVLWQRHLKGVLFEYLRGLPDAKSILDSWKKEFDK